MNISGISKNNLNFESLKIKIKGKNFDNHPKDADRIRDAINNNENIMNFYKDRDGKILVKSKNVKIPVAYDYPDFMRNPDISDSAPDQFVLECTKPVIDIKCTYKRKFAMKNLFKKPVSVITGTRADKSTTWKSCMDGALECIKLLGKDSPEDMKKRGDSIQRDLYSVEARRLKIEEA